MQLNHYLGVFSPEELDRITELGDSLDLVEGAVLVKGKDSIEHKKRNTKIAWVHHTLDTSWIFTRMSKMWMLEPISMLQSFQYSVYHVGGHYDWHQDVSQASPEPECRKLSLTFCLTDPDTYEGGNLEFFNGGKGFSDFPLPDGRVIKGEQVAKDIRAQGSAIVFDSYDWHRVTPVTKGIRYSIVCWTVGPKPV